MDGCAEQSKVYFQKKFFFNLKFSRHPKGGIQEAVWYARVKFGEEGRAGDMNLEVISMEITLRFTAMK